jgi:hypothetical protein
MSVIDCIQQDYQDTMQDLKDKGAVIAVRDAAMDAVSLVGSTAAKAVHGARSLASDLVVAEDARPASNAAQPQAEVTEAEGESRSSDVSTDTAEAATANVSSGESANLLDLPLFDTIKQEFSSTVQDFREKGAIGVVKDAALDAKDIIGGTARTVVNSAKSFVGDASVAQDASTDDAAQSASSEGDVGTEATVTSDGESVNLLDLPLLGGLKQGYHDTVQDFREKGAIGAVKDAALDAADIVRGSAAFALDGARRAGDSLLAVVSVPTESEAEGVGASSSESSRTSPGGTKWELKNSTWVTKNEGGLDAEELID